MATDEPKNDEQKVHSEQTSIKARLRRLIGLKTATRQGDDSENETEEGSRLGNFVRALGKAKLFGRLFDSSEEPEEPKTWKERLTFVADNAKGDKDAPSYLFGMVRAYPMVDTSSNMHYRWLLVINLAVMYNLIFVVGRSVFWEMQKLSPTAWNILDYFCDTLYIIDLLVRMHEGYLEKGLLVKDGAKLRMNYIKGPFIKIDILSVLPTDLAYIYFTQYCHEQVPCPVICRINRIFRLDRMFEFFDKTETRTNFPNAFRITKIILYIIILIHWNACFFFAVSFAIGFEKDVWVYQGSSDLPSQYIYSFYWSTLTLTTIGETAQPVLDEEHVFVIIDFLAGVIIFATIVGNIGTMITNMSADRTEFQNRMDAIKQYLVFRKVGHDLENRVIKWFDYIWDNNQTQDEEEVLSILPDQLKAEIAMHVHLETLKKVKIFQECEQGLLVNIVLKLKLTVFAPGDYVCRKGDVGKEMYIIKRGKLDVVSEDGKKVFVTLGEGVVFGELSILNVPGSKMGNRRTANVRSKGYSDLFSLNKDDLWHALTEYPDAKKMLLEKGREILLKDNMIDEEKAKKEEAAQTTTKEKIQLIDQSVSSLLVRFGRVKDEFENFQQRMKHRVAALEVKHGTKKSLTEVLPFDKEKTE